MLALVMGQVLVCSGEVQDLFDLVHELLHTNNSLIIQRKEIVSQVLTLFGDSFNVTSLTCQPVQGGNVGQLL